MYSKEIEAVFINEVEDAIKEKIRDIRIYWTLYVRSCNRKCDETSFTWNNYILVKNVQEEWEMAVVDYAECKCNFARKITDLQKELMECHTKI